LLFKQQKKSVQNKSVSTPSYFEPFSWTASSTSPKSWLLFEHQKRSKQECFEKKKKVSLKRSPFFGGSCFGVLTPEAFKTRVFQGPEKKGFTLVFCRTPGPGSSSGRSLALV
jgi:hypothetical protein